MTKVVCCIDGSAISISVCDGGAWASQRLGLPLKLLHVLEKPVEPVTADLSGSIGLGSREHLLEELTNLEEQRGRQALEEGKEMLEVAAQRAQEDGATDITRQQRHGELVETLRELEEDTRLVVMGRLGEGHAAEAHEVGSHLEKLVRVTHRPILVTVGEFSAPRNFMLAYDGNASAEKALRLVVDSELLRGLPCHLVMVGTPTGKRSKRLARAQARLIDAGFEVRASLVEGEVQPALAKYQRANGIDLMAMGAYGHAHLWEMVFGSRTAEIVSNSEIPLLLLREDW